MITGKASAKSPFIPPFSCKILRRSHCLNIIHPWPRPLKTRYVEEVEEFDLRRKTLKQQQLDGLLYRP